MREKITDWLIEGGAGLSAQAMARHLIGKKTGGWGDKAHPLDPDDFHRCLKFLDAVPEARERLPELAEISQTWAALVWRWSDVEASFFKEVGDLELSKGTSAPKTYALMKAIGC